MKNIDAYLADIAVVNVKLHNLHWNVTGSMFKAVHEYLEELYDDFFEKFDEVAEYQKMQGVFPKASLKEYLEISEIKELESKEIDQKEALKETLSILKHMIKRATKIAEKSEDFILTNMMEDHITGYVKSAWFIENMLK